MWTVIVAKESMNYNHYVLVKQQVYVQKRVDFVQRDKMMSFPAVSILVSKITRMKKEGIKTPHKDTIKTLCFDGALIVQVFSCKSATKTLAMCFR